MSLSAVWGVDWNEAIADVVNHMRKAVSQVDRECCAARNGTWQ